ncbi:FUSC family protein [Vibrio vulnificus]|nr:FUSC family protein [Vibrio vulnificus]
MFSASTKEAIKAALAIVFALCLAMWFQWDKPYWAAIAVAVMALNETFAHSLQKGQNRIIGALMGTGYALFLITLFSQDRFLFIAFYTLFLAVSLFMASDEKRGYIFVQGYTVCTIICCMGGFDSIYTFHYMMLRIQETLLGIVVFTLVYKLLWPVTTQSKFTQHYATLHTALKTAVEQAQQGTLSGDEILPLQQSAKQLHHLLELPNSGSYDLQFYQQEWLERLREILVITHLLESVCKDRHNLAHYLPEVARLLAQFDAKAPITPLIPSPLFERAQRHLQHKPFSYPRSVKQHIKDDGLKVLQGVSMFVTAVLLWIYLPVPGGFVFPMIAGIFATNIPPLPPSAIKDAFWGTIGLGSFYLVQYVFLMPSFSELWQLASFYFINVVAIWKVFDTARLGIFRVLAVNLLLVLSSSAQNLTPSYSFSLPAMMVVYVLLLLMISSLFAGLFHPKARYHLPH